MDTRLPYDDAASVQDMTADCRATGQHLRLDRAARAAVRPAPGIGFDAFPREVAKRDIEVSEAAARLAGALNLQLDGD